jgi:phosphorylcholine metabolism protein LicD
MYNYDTSEYVVALANYGKASNCVKKSVMMNINKHQFENLSCNIPVDYDTYLTAVYGDYMTPRKY